jgi:metal-responsive CopG/Arc/MetJ family transcriptional regulator
MARTHVVIPEELLAEIDQVVGQGGRSRFLETAAREKLDRLALEESRRGPGVTSGDAGYRPWRDRRSNAPDSD